MTVTRTLLASAAGIAMFAIAGQPASATTVRIYATNSGGDNLHVIDPSTNKVESIIKGIEGAHGVAFSPDGSRVYVSNEADSTLDVFDRKSGMLPKKVPLRWQPNNIAVGKDGGIRVAGAAERGA